MSAQIGDNYIYNDISYDLVATSGNIGFNPKDYGMKPMSSSTACWRGYWCDYEITEKGFFLKNLYLYNGNDEYPPLLGIEPSPVTYHKAERCGENGLEYVDKPDYMGHRLYENIGLNIPYTGKLLLGDGFLSKYYIHMGYQRSWAYETLLEFVFEEGRLIKINDLSNDAKLQREAIDNGKSNGQTSPGSVDDVESFVTDSFSLSYEDKAWWLKK